MLHTHAKIGPLDAGRRMSLDEFDPCETESGHQFELEGGIVIVTEVPLPSHFLRVDAIRDQLTLYKLTHRGIIRAIGSGGECKLLISECESERHPDLAVYKTDPPQQDRGVWRIWIPEIVVEVVSRGSEHRDYVIKREEYLTFGVSEYWTVDPIKQEFLVLRRLGDRWDEQILVPSQRYTTNLLPGFELELLPIFFQETLGERG